MMANPPAFARTKLYPPRLRSNLLHRERLVARVRQALLDVRLLLISAPAGSGKTTLLAAALAELPYHAAWVAIDEDDNDLVRFLLLLAAAFDQLCPGAAAAVQSQLAAGNPLTDGEPEQRGRQTISTLLNLLLQPGILPALLILDDLHLITEPAIYATLGYLVERLPEGLTLAVGTRHDPPLPLARLRARRELAEVRLPDLRFTAAEAQALLTDQLGLALASEEMTLLHQRTEGWAAGLSLLASSLEGMLNAEERVRFLHHLAQRDRYLFDYLADEVLQRQSAPMRQFLLESAILSELTPDLCYAVTGRANAGALLEELYRRNLFLVALAQDGGHDGGTPAYRYHGLFALFLRESLQREQPEHVPLLHRRAAAAEQDPVRRIHHLLAAAAWDEAAAAIEQVAPQFIGQGTHGMVLEWMAALPAATRQSRAWLNYWEAICLWQAFDLSAAQQQFQSALAAFDAAGDRQGREQTLAWIATGLSYWNDLDAARELVTDALAQPLPAALHAQILTAFSTGLMLNGQHEEADLRLNEALTLAENAAAQGDASVALTILSGVQAPHVVLPGGATTLERLLHVMDHLCETIPGLETPAIEARRCGIRALVELARGRVYDAMASCQRMFAAAAAHGAGATWLLLNAGGLLAGMQAVLGIETPVRDEALEHLTTLDVSAANTFTRIVMGSFLFHLGRVQWMRGEFEAARATNARIEALAHGVNDPSVQLLNLMLAGLLAQTDGDLETAQAAFTRSMAMQEGRNFTLIHADAQVFWAALLHRMGRSQEALDAFLPRLAYYAANNIPGMLMWNGPLLIPLLQMAQPQSAHADFVARLLQLFNVTPAPAAALPAPTSAPAPTVALAAQATTETPAAEAIGESLAASGLYIPHTGETLTPREVEVLRLLATGLGNNAIAEQLVISPHTAKHHVSHLLAKLGVTTRTQAILWARDAGLIET